MIEKIMKGFVWFCTMNFVICILTKILELLSGVNGIFHTFYLVITIFSLPMSKLDFITMYFSLSQIVFVLGMIFTISKIHNRCTS